ncbi:Aminoglycoside phosphotransferase [Penicillium coprophilum]|uniref:Aminoglycoside phosphotransferase n=1 Tax=Penicillium coprophilum TaxID=36646 RepID=UPI0023967AAE|nr:Aminoglycoside phosphotransferase [Penicillium coprophilum]KAJ5158902.1 Aminoglycoside phosphotransferase [Penicillium coprophilum]
MAKRLFGTIPYILHPRKIIPNTRLTLARPISTFQKIPKPCDLFEYTYNDNLRRHERRQVFNISGLKRLATLAGGFNRTFLITIRDSYRFIAQILYPATELRFLLVASEVATLGFLRAYSILVPKVFSYSTIADNCAGTEYIFIEYI